MAYEDEVREVIEVAVETEKMGRAFYEKMAEMFAEQTDISGLFSTLAKDERVHEKLFRSLLAEVPGCANPQTTKESLSFLKIMVLPETLLSDEGAREKQREIQTPQDALYRALALEKDTFAYYQAMKELFGEQEALNRIIQEEKQHITKLTEHLITGAKMRGMSDNFAR